MRLKPLIAEKAKKNQGRRTDLVNDFINNDCSFGFLENIPQNSVKSIDTQKELAEIAKGRGQKDILEKIAKDSQGTRNDLKEEAKPNEDTTSVSIDTEVKKENNKKYGGFPG